MKLKPGQMLLALCIILVACRSNGDWSSTSIPTDDTATVTMQAVSPTTTVVLPTTTPYPTLEPTLLGERLNEALNNPVCELPCWWGVIPGQTRAEEAVELFYRHAGISMEYFERDGYHGLQGNTGDAYLHQSGEACGSFELGLEGGIVMGIRISMDLCPGGALKEPSLSIEKILKQHGTPDKVLFHLAPDVPTPGPFPIVWLPYSLMLLYEQEGFSITYSGGTYLKETLSICPMFDGNQIYQMEIAVQQKGASDSEFKQLYGERFLALDEINGIEPKAFYDLFNSQTPDPCFEILYEALQPAVVNAPENDLMATSNPLPLPGIHDSPPLACPSILSALPSEERLPGRLILYRNSVHEFVSANTGQSLGEYPGELWLFGPKDAYQPKITPNRQWMLIFKERDSIVPKCHVALVPLSAQQKPVHCLDTIVPRNSFVDWVNDEWLHVRKHDLDGSPDQEWWVNPWTLEVRSFAHDEYPAAYEKARQRLLSFSPDFSKVVYLGNGPYGRGYDLVLWDSEKQQALMKQELAQEGIYLQQEWQKWRTDGEQWLVIMPQKIGNDQVVYDLVLFDRNGKVLAKTDGQFSSIGEFSWSSDGKQIAFVYSQRDAAITQSDAAIWNWKTGEVQTLCIPVQGMGDMVYGEPIWSPDSRYLAVGSCVFNARKYSKCQDIKIWLWDSVQNRAFLWFEGQVYLDAWYEPAQ